MYILPPTIIANKATKVGGFLHFGVEITFVFKTGVEVKEVLQIFSLMF